MSEQDDSLTQLGEEVQLLREHFAAQELEIVELRRELSRAREQIRLFVEHAPAAVAILDQQMRYLLATKRWREDYGLGDQELIARSHDELVPDQPQRWKDMRRRVLAGAVEEAEEEPYPHADGTTDWLSWKALPWYDAEGELGGLCLFTQVVTKRKEAEEALRETVERQQRLIDMIREISTPVIPVHDEVLVLPLIGTIDSQRSAQVMESLLTAVQEYSADVVIIDITGVPIVDTSVANHLIQSTQAATLLGAHCILVGISAEVAQTLVQLGVNLNSLVTRGNLQDGIAYALARQGRAITDLPARNGHPSTSGGSPLRANR